jgi:hypothetical protein
MAVKFPANPAATCLVKFQQFQMKRCNATKTFYGLSFYKFSLQSSVLRSLCLLCLLRPFAFVSFVEKKN